MKSIGRRLGLLVLAALLCAPAAGCFGLDTNPSYFPYLLPFQDIITTHDKPISPGNDANFDPKANTLVLMPLEATSRVRTQHVVLATVYDAKGTPLRNRTVKWELEGVGTIVEVDSNGVVPGRGHPITDKYGVSYTRYHETRITRGNANAADDFMVRPGQTYCVVTSPVEGDTHITAYAPGIFNWDNRVVHTTIRWVDVHWEFPPPAVARFGTEHVFVTKLMRFSDRRPIQGYEVRYRILDGPPAVFLPNRAQEIIVKSDANGDAPAHIVQAAPGAGINRVSVDILRPPDPTTPSGSVVPIASGETSVEWLAPSIALSHTGPPTIPAGADGVFTTVVTNTGRIESRAVTVTLISPDELQFVGANPPGLQNGKELIWTLATLAPGQSYTIQTTYKGVGPGPATSVAMVQTSEGLRDQQSAVTQVTVPDLALDVQGPATAIVNMPVKFVVTLRNPGSAVLEDVQIEADFDAGLEFAGATQSHRLTLGAGTLAPQQTRTVDLDLTPRKVGPLGLKVTARAAGLAREKTAIINVAAPKMSLDVIEGPQKRVAGRPGEWKIRVANEGDVPLTNVTVRDRLPPELEFDSASDNGQPVLGEVTWSLGTLAPRTQRVLVVKAKATRPSPQAVQVIAATADPGLTEQTQNRLEIIGLGALGTNLVDLADPIEIGKVEKYQLEITNTGSAPVTNIVVRGTATVELKPMAGAGPGGAPGVVAGQTITFGKYDGLGPGMKAVYTFEAQTLKAGDARFEVQITSDLNAEPLTLQQSTRIVAPLPGPGQPAQPAAPEGAKLGPLSPN
jgi:uncharacterized repeat protein (TIGR01451 family)